MEAVDLVKNLANLQSGLILQELDATMNLQ